MQNPVQSVIRRKIRCSNRRAILANPGKKRHKPLETRAYATVCNGHPEPAKIISGEDRIRTCGPVSRSPI